MKMLLDGLHEPTPQGALPAPPAADLEAVSASLLQESLLPALRDMTSRELIKPLFLKHSSQVLHHLYQRCSLHVLCRLLNSLPRSN